MTMGSRLVSVFLVSVSIWLRIVGKLMCLLSSFYADKTRNMQSIMGLNIKERTAKLLERSKTTYSWKHILFEKVIKVKPFRKNNLSGNYVLFFFLIRSLCLCLCLCLMPYVPIFRCLQKLR